MSKVLGVALYFVIWWTVLFAILPFGIKSQFESGDIVPGSEGAAPARPLMLWKFLATTVIAAVLWGVVYLFIAGHILSLDAIPLGPR